MANITEYEIENSLISDNIFDDFMNEKTILSKDRKTPIDIWISYIAFISAAIILAETVLHLERFILVSLYIICYTIPKEYKEIIHNERNTIYYTRQ